MECDFLQFSKLVFSLTHVYVDFQFLKACQRIRIINWKIISLIKLFSHYPDLISHTLYAHPFVSVYPQPLFLFVYQYFPLATERKPNLTFLHVLQNNGFELVSTTK